MSSISQYMNHILSSLKTGEATEHSYRSALKTLLETLFYGLAALNEPKRQRVGAPDFIIMKQNVPVGYIETKDIGTSLDAIERTDQLQRYLDGLENLILTNYLEFRWYVKGTLRLEVKLGTLGSNDTIRRKKGQDKDLTDLLKNFVNQESEIVNSSEELAMRMATLSKVSYQIISRVLNLDTDKTSELYQQYEIIKETLIHDIDKDEFADMLAQTISYGLFTARLHQSSSDEFNRMTAAYIIPETNPFLRDLFSEVVGPSIDNNLVWIVEDLVKLLNHTNLQYFFTNFGGKVGKEDPILHFYETFLEYYKPEEKSLRGVYYTPDSVVKYIIKSVDYKLSNSFGMKKGLAETTNRYVQSTRRKEQELLPKVQILDPAVGTGTFLSNIIDYIYENKFKENMGMWKGYVQDYLLPRLNGFELLMAPYTIAHMKLGLKLAETGYEFTNKMENRLRIYLNNSLDKPDETTGQPLFSIAKFISGEAEAADNVKKNYPIMVIVGNPPYSGESANNIKWINSLLRGWDEVNEKEIDSYFKIDGSPLGERNTKWLNDDYVKFIRFSQWKIEQTGYGVLAFITPHGYLDNPTFKGMRKSLMKTFDDIYILDLHGNANKQESKNIDDENVFEISQGVAISIFVKVEYPRKKQWIYHTDLWGSRDYKYNWLNNNDLESTNWEQIYPTAPLYLFVPEDTTYKKEYEECWSIVEAMPLNSNGIVTARDHFTIYKDKNKLLEVINDFTNLDVEEAREKYKLGKDVRDWKVELAQQDLLDTNLSKDNIVPVYYRPFDYRYTYYTGKSKGFLCMPRKKVMDNFIHKNNLAIITSRMTKGENFQHLSITNTISEAIALSGKTSNNAFSFPLYAYYDAGKSTNFSSDFIKYVENRTGLFFSSNEKGQGFSAFDLFSYIVSILSSPLYRDRYNEYLKRDYPRIPITTEKQLFYELSDLGRELIDIHLLKMNFKLATRYPIEDDNVVDVISYQEMEEKLWINENQYFSNVDLNVWNYEIGGYQVLKKWLHSHLNDKLDYDKLNHFQKIIESIKEMIKKQKQIDELISSYKGFPLQ